MAGAPGGHGHGWAPGGSERLWIGLPSSPRPSTVPPGDAQRVWFPAMLEALRNTWSSSMGWDQLIAFCASMTELRREIRQARGLRPPRMRCSHCGSETRSDIKGVSVRSALFALRKEGIVTEAERRELDEGWKRYRAEHGLDYLGQPVDTTNDWAE